MIFPVVSAIIALIGVALSGAFAYWVACHQGALRFNELLYQARLACYPQLYAIASRLAKNLHYETLTREVVRTETAQLDNWDSDHALVLSPISVKAIHHLRWSLHKLLSSDVILTDPAVSGPMLRALAAVENALKTEIGVYSLSDYHNPPFVRDVSEYIERVTEK